VTLRTVVGEDNGWVLSLTYPAAIDFDKFVIKYSSITRYVGGASNDIIPNLQQPNNPVPLPNDQIERLHRGRRRLTTAIWVVLPLASIS
jgi:hypothetical protein